MNRDMVEATVKLPFKFSHPNQHNYILKYQPQEKSETKSARIVIEGICQTVGKFCALV